MSDGSAPRPVSTSRRFTEMFDTFLGGPARVQPRHRANAPILELRHVDASYGPFRALFDVSFRLWPGQATALLGSNGAGKTTVARVATGLVEPTEGTVSYDGNDATGFSAWEFSRMGIAHIAEGRSVFGTLSVEQNLNLAFRQLLGPEQAKETLERAYEMYPVLYERRRQAAGTLSGGQQRILSLARVLPEPPRLLVADELSLGLAPLIVDAAFDTLAQLKEAGTALLIIEQHVERALALADRVILLQKGRVTYDGPPDEIGDAIDEVMLMSRAEGTNDTESE